MHVLNSLESGTTIICYNKLYNIIYMYMQYALHDTSYLYRLPVRTSLEPRLSFVGHGVKESLVHTICACVRMALATVAMDNIIRLRLDRKRARIPY